MGKMAAATFRGGERVATGLANGNAHFGTENAAETSTEGISADARTREITKRSQACADWAYWDDFAGRAWRRRKHRLAT
jgi:hypothetical protein